MTEKKTSWTCEYCGEEFNSRAARLYHWRNVCRKDPRSKMYDGLTRDAPPTVTTPENFEQVTIDVETTEPEETAKKTAPGALQTQATPKPAYTNPAAGDDDEGEEGAEEEAVPWILIVPIVILVLLVAGALIFRDKITALWRAHVKPVTIAVHP
jgi:hypothetical protein